jgi:hypothetical protein
MPLTPEERAALGANCLSSSWQALGPLLQRAHCPPTARPDILLDWLSHGQHRSQAMAEQLLRAMSQRLWRIEAAAAAVAAAPAAAASNGLLGLRVVCAGQAWTLWLCRQPQLRVQHISR